ncbi:MAG: hypothetical protein J6S53_04520 [Lentisphaeria bacterium]|nr:hypothetical protein [Lentisphaeria bacterium]
MKVVKHVMRKLGHPVSRPLRTMGYRDFTSNDDWKNNLISFTSLAYHPERKTVVCGMTSFNNELMVEFDPAKGTFTDLAYRPESEKFEIKIHRSLHLDRKGNAYGATACLHREDQRLEAKGGRIFYYDFETKKYDFLGIPVPHDYIQTITVDEDRGLIYGVTYPVFEFFAFDIRTRTVKFRQYMGSAPHIMALDDKGGVWSTWNTRTHNLFRYDPDTNTVQYFNHSLMPGQGADLMYPGAGPIDMMLNGGDGLLYVGCATGDLLRIHPETAEVEYLGRPTPERRMPALEVGPDGRIYGISGFYGKCHLFAYDREKRNFEDFGLITDGEDQLYIGHDICFAEGNRIFAGETDTEERAGYLWECIL